MLLGQAAACGLIPQHLLSVPTQRDQGLWGLICNCIANNLAASAILGLQVAGKQQSDICLSMYGSHQQPLRCKQNASMQWRKPQIGAKDFWSVYLHDG